MSLLSVTGRSELTGAAGWTTAFHAADELFQDLVVSRDLESKKRMDRIKLLLPAGWSPSPAVRARISCLKSGHPVVEAGRLLKWQRTLEPREACDSPEVVERVGG